VVYLLYHGFCLTQDKLHDLRQQYQDKAAPPPEEVKKQMLEWLNVLK
jgi:hypothetical protein